jgi:tRNA(Ile)-lysidine synthase
MRPEIRPGSYVVAVSGGVDSMALLHMLKQQYGESKEHCFIVAHFDHGIRIDSRLDRELVQAASRQYGLQFVYDEGHLGAGASEAAARQARYNFLEKVQRAADARAIVTAHHQDDVLETALLNLMRGTNRRGLASLRSTDAIVRPLLGVSKGELQAYAKQHKLAWREDSTNSDMRYRRNYIRHQILGKADEDTRDALIRLIDNARRINDELDAELADYVTTHHGSGDLNRRIFMQLPDNIAREVMAYWLRSKGIISYDSRGLTRLVTAAKTLSPGSKADVLQGHFLLIGRENLALK